MNKRVILPMALALLGLAGCASSDFEVNAVFSVQGQNSLGSSESWLDRGRKEYAANRCGLAIRHFRNALNAKPDSVIAMNGMAACYDRLKRFDLSERFYRAALAQDPQSAQTLNNLGYSYYLQNKPDLAVSFLQEAVRRGARNPLIEKNIRLAEVALARKVSAANTVNKVASKQLAAFKSFPSQPASVKKVRMVRTGKSSTSLLTRKQNLEWQAAILQPPLPPKRQKALPVVAQRISREAMVVKTAMTSNFPAESDKPEPAKRQKALLVVAKRPSPEAMVVKTALASNFPVENEKPEPVKAVLKVASTPVSTKKELVPDEASVALKVPDRFAVEVSNGTGRRRMAARMREFLAESGHDVRWLTNAKTFRIMVSTIFYKSGAKDAASLLASTLPVTPRLALRDVQRASLQLELGGDLLRFDRKLIHSYDDVTKVHSHVEL